MRSNNKLFAVILFLAGLAFAYGLTKLFLLRFAGGDVYPQYSSLRADPLGIKVFYDSLNLLPGVAVERSYQPLTKLAGTEPATMFYLGNQPRLNMADVDALEAFVRQGGRIVMALYPTEQEKAARDTEKKTNQKMEEPEKKKKEEQEPVDQMLSLSDRWKFSIDYVKLPGKRSEHFSTVEVQRADELSVPAAIPWHSTLVFGDLDPEWRVIYERDERPVMIERKLGRGSIVLASDCYFVSNEAMSRDRQPQLLGWLVGPYRHVIFEETHLGIVENPGVAALARRYQLHGLLAAVLVLAGLFVWKNAVTFVPPYQDEAEDGSADHIAGKDHATGFINLLRRSIPQREILNICFSEWKKTFATGRAMHREKLERMEKVVESQAALPARQRQPISNYQTLSRIVVERK